MIRDNILSRLSETEGASVAGLLQIREMPMTAETAAAVEVLLAYSPEVVVDDGKWKLAQVGRSATILAEIRNYSVATGKKIFRLSAALQRIPPEDHPTEQQLQRALELSHGEYELLPNALIKRNS